MIHISWVLLLISAIANGWLYFDVRYNRERAKFWMEKWRSASDFREWVEKKSKQKSDI